jgi:hypothetical protein
MAAPCLERRAISVAPDPRDKAWRFHTRLDYKASEIACPAREHPRVCHCSQTRPKGSGNACQSPREEEKPVRAIIDKSVPSALTYYSTYLAEPSPAGDMTFKKDDIVAYDHLDLKKLLT